MPLKARTVEVASRAVDLARAMRQKNQVELNSDTGAKGEAHSAAVREIEASAATASLERPAVTGPSMEVVVGRENLKKALAQVKRNKGAPGIDGMTVEDLASYLKEHWLTIRAQLLEGTYKPLPVRRVEIRKASGGTRSLGIPTALDRFLQQAVMQVLQAEWDGTFSEASFGFRPRRFVRSDDCNIYVRSQRAGERVMASIERFRKSAVCRACIASRTSRNKTGQFRAFPESQNRGNHERPRYFPGRLVR